MKLFNNFWPKVLVILYDEKDSTEDKVKTKAEIDFDIFGLDIGEHITKTVVTDVSFNDIDIPKTLQIVLVEAYDINYRVMVDVEKEFIAEWWWYMDKKYHKEVSIKNRWIALLLAIFLGGLGIHRFYVGKIGTGIIYFFTGGIFGIGIILDVILIIIGSFTDKDGKFLK